MKQGRPVLNGLYVSREIVCPCGTVKRMKSPEARYCSNPCRIKYGQYGRAYQQPMPRAYGWTR